MQYRQSIVTLTSVSTLACAVLVTGCDSYGSDGDEAALAANDPANPATNGNVDGTAESTTESSDGTTSSESNDTTTMDNAAAGSDGDATEGAPDVDRAPTTDGEATPEGGGDGEAMPDGETMPDGEPVTMPDPPVVVIGERPCDIYESGGTPCVAAYSMVRSLYGTYDGPLYQVRRGAPNPYMNTGMGGDLLDIGLTADGFADAAAQDAFCGNQPCTVSIIYDQSPMGNDLRRGPAGCFTGAEGTAAEDDYESDAAAHALTVGGHDVYSLFTRPHEGYRNNDAVGTAQGTESQGVYMVADGTHYGAACCFDFGNASRDTCYGQTGIMNSVMLGTAFWGSGSGPGPWMMADFELGVWAGGSRGIFPGMLEFINGQLNPGEDPIVLSGTEIPPDEIVWEQNPSMPFPYVFGTVTSEYVEAEGRSHYAIRSGNATAGNTLITAHDDWTEIQFVQEGAIILGIGGDNSNFSFGTFYEGAMTAGRPAPGIDVQVYRNVQAAGYGQ